jgi:FixJ family two-component response regulator
MPPPLVVVVEDNRSTLRALSRVLRAGGFEPAPYNSAEQYLASPPKRLPLCVVLDVRLSRTSGLDLQRQLQVVGPSLPVIVMSAFDDPRVRDEAIRMGCVGYVHKEDDAAALLEMIRALPVRDHVR